MARVEMKNFITKPNYKLNSSAHSSSAESWSGWSDNHFHPRRLFGTSAPNIVLIGNKTGMFEVKMRLALIQSLFYPQQATHVHGVDLLDDVRCLMKNLFVENMRILRMVFS